MFLAPALYAVHAVLTGLAMVTMDLLDARLGFGFSAGLFDYALNYNKATRPWMLLPVGAVYGLLYYGLFRYFIGRFGLNTPGREAEEAPVAVRVAGGAGIPDGFIAALGGAANLVEVAACTTRLRLVLADRGRVDAAALRALGSRGTVNVGERGLQVVVGPIADQVAGDIRARLACATPGDAIPDAARVLAALGGADNVARIETAAGRVLVTVKDGARVDASDLNALFPRGVARPNASSVHLLHAGGNSIAASLALTESQK